MAPVSSAALLLSLVLLGPAAARAQACGNASFPAKTPNIECQGLSAQPSATSRDACQAACCAAGADACGVWQWCAPDAPCFSGTGGVSCWLGQAPASQCVDNGEGWTGAARSAATCGAATFAVATPDIECFGLTANPFATTRDACVAACCAAGASQCSTWQYCDTGNAALGCTQTGTANNVSCWLGHPVGDANNQVCHAGPGWVGGIRGAPPVVGQYYAVVPVNASTGFPTNLAARHCNSMVSADPYRGLGNQDFYFRAVAGVNDNADSVSLQPYNYYFDAVGAVASSDANPFAALSIARFPEVDADALSWVVTPGLDNAAFFSLKTQSTDPAKAGQYMSVASPSSVQCQYNGPVGDFLLAPGNSVPGVTPAGNTSAGAVLVTRTFMFIPISLQQDVRWTQEHHDAQNSGNSAWDGPGESTGVCVEQMIKDDPLAVGERTARFFSTGVTSAADSWWFGGDSSDTLFMLEDLEVAQQNDDSWQSWTLNMTAVLGVANPAAPYGIVGSPAVLFPPDYQTAAYLSLIHI
jgi:hypothetical protein